MTEKQISTLERFVNLIMQLFCDHTSGYKGKYAVFHSLSSSQRLADYNELRPDLTIHIGEISETILLTR